MLETIKALLADPAIQTALLGASGGIAVLLLKALLLWAHGLVSKTETTLDDEILDAIESVVAQKVALNSDGKKVFLTGDKTTEKK